MRSSRATNTAASALPDIFRKVIVGLVRREGHDLSTRQLAIFLTTMLEPGPHTVRGLAAHLNLKKPNITRSLDRLALFDLIRRLPDPSDRRSVLIGRTESSGIYLAMMRRFAEQAASEVVAGEAFKEARRTA